jgi:hypothetical protein
MRRVSILLAGAVVVLLLSGLAYELVESAVHGEVTSWRPPCRHHRFVPLHFAGLPVPAEHC